MAVKAAGFRGKSNFGVPTTESLVKTWEKYWHSQYGPLRYFRLLYRVIKKDCLSWQYN
jgi:hypothetical protein